MDEKHKKPSNYTILYWLIQDKKIEPAFFFNFLDFFWPKIINIGNYYFLKEKYSDEVYAQHENSNPEYWINLVTVDDFFLGDNADKEAVRLALSLVEIWKAKLKYEYPSINFTVEFLTDSEHGDCGLTFYQTNV